MQEYYDNYFALFATEGWKQFVKENQQSLDDLNKITSCPDDEFQKRKGKCEVYATVCNFENFIRLSFEQIEQENANTV
jgi:hypothetical protein